MLHRHRLPDTNFRISEHWTADTKQEILQEFSLALVDYPEKQYASMLSHVRPDPTGLIWHANFSRRFN